MSAIGSLMFCDDCGSLLDRSNKEMLTCDHCGSTWKDVSARVVVTKSKPSDYPSTLRAKMSQVQTVPEETRRVEADIRQPCENCGEEEVKYYEMQLRSADEGSTIFYRCVKCGHKWNTNN